jgi:3-deoxy-D-manno-octulosonate 8-phosphate phosphatase (KDO 8-P phosphatase)
VDPPSPSHDAGLLARAAAIKLACFDVDGTLTDGRLYFDGEGRESKAFHAMDGHGLVLLRQNGIHVAFVTARASRAAEKRAADLGIEACIGVSDKLACVRQLAQRLGAGLHEVAFMGDDLPDLAVMSRVGLAVAPANAHASMLPHVHWRTQARGGEGAAREFCDLVLSAQGKAGRVLQQALGR